MFNVQLTRFIFEGAVIAWDFSMHQQSEAG